MDAQPQHAPAANNPLEEARRQLLREMKQTKGSRFNAANRLEQRDRSRTKLMAYASASVIIVTLLPAFVPLPSFLNSLFNLITVAFSLVILAATLLQSSDADPVKANELHHCAIEVNSQLRGLRSETALTEEKLKSYSVEYSTTLARYSVNHEDNRG
jgi:hypothetical protein